MIVEQLEPTAAVPAAGAQASVARFTSALLKVASRCNIDCDYCYVYKHADQSWRQQPRLMSEATIEQFARRLREYLDLHDQPEFSITFHGGEPLLFGSERMAAAARVIREVVGPLRLLKFSLQTNATLLTDEVISQLEAADISVSLSLDGPKEANDLHRRDHGGRSTFDAVFAAIERLRARRSPVFSGVIAVIDPEVPPRRLFEFFAPMGLPRLDLLLPDATHERLPPGREKSPGRYSTWLQEAMRLWFTEFSELPVRWFDALLASRLGVPSPTDAMGLGAVSMIVIDTDGGYTDHDVFKITKSNGGALRCHLTDTSLEEVSRHVAIREHCFRLTRPGLASECRSCPVVEACGGGTVMHRWHPRRGLEAPSVYRGELFAVLETGTQLIRESLHPLHRAATRELIPLTAGIPLTVECRRWRAETEARATDVATRMGIVRNSESAAALLLYERHEAARCCAGSPRFEKAGDWLGSIKLQSEDPRLVAPFLDTIRVFPRESARVRHGIAMLRQARDFLAILQPTLPDAFACLISDMIFVESTVEAPHHIFSFSDDSAPAVLYVSPFAGDAPLGADDLGDSLLHEFQHQVLYQIERDGPVLLDQVYPRFPAPWRDGLRPSGGFLHGTFVFTGLTQYWTALARAGLPGIDCDKASDNAERFAKQAAYGVHALRQFALLTLRGELLVDLLAETLALREPRIRAPGAALVC